jgi:hypothetical protein
VSVAIFSIPERVVTHSCGGREGGKEREKEREGRGRGRGRERKSEGEKKRERYTSSEQLFTVLIVSDIERMFLIMWGIH